MTDPMAGGSGGRPGALILAVEDEARNAALLRAILGPAGYDLTIAASLAEVGRPVLAPIGYRLRQGAIDGFLDAASRSGLAETTGPVEPGDVLLVRPGPAQHHLVVAAAGGFVHAHAGLGRIVLTPPPLEWPVEHHWRLAAE